MISRASNATPSKIMSESNELLFRTLGLLISVVGAYWVFRDSMKLKASGASLTPLIWATLVFLSWFVSLPAYLVLRRWYWQKQIGEGENELLQLVRTATKVERSEKIEDRDDVCSEAAIRALASELRHLSVAEAWEKMRDHYDENACADVLDVDRFEEVLLEAFE